MAHVFNASSKQLCFRFRDVTIIKPGADGYHSTHRAPHWNPPKKRSDFDVREETKWLIWDGRSFHEAPGTLSQTNEICRHSEATLFWCPEIAGFVQVPYDCTAEDVAVHEKDEAMRGWNPISFEEPDDRVKNQFPHLWLVGSLMKESQIKLPISDSWEDLLGQIYFYEGLHGKNRSRTCDLAGSLPILFGLIAFTLPWEKLKRDLNKALQPMSVNSYYYVPTWQRQLDSADGKPRHRGLVVEVGYHFGQHERTEIQAYERGFEGPILRSNPHHNRTQYIIRN